MVAGLAAGGYSLPDVTRFDTVTVDVDDAAVDVMMRRLTAALKIAFMVPPTGWQCAKARGATAVGEMSCAVVEEAAKLRGSP